MAAELGQTCGEQTQRKEFYAKQFRSFTCMRMRWTDLRETGSLAKEPKPARNWPTDISERHYGWFLTE